MCILNQQCVSFMADVLLSIELQLLNKIQNNQIREVVRKSQYEVNVIPYGQGHAFKIRHRSHTSNYTSTSSLCVHNNAEAYLNYILSVHCMFPKRFI